MRRRKSAAIILICLGPFPPERAVSRGDSGGIVSLVNKQPVDFEIIATWTTLDHDFPQIGRTEKQLVFGRVDQCARLG